MDTGATTTEARPYHLFGLVLESGECFPILTNARTGTPARLALRYAVAHRHRIATSTLEKKLRSIAELYDVVETTEGILADQLLEQPAANNPANITRWLRLAGLADRKRHSAGAITNRVSAWREFLRWIASPLNWRTGFLAGDDNNPIAVRAAIERVDLAFEGWTQRTETGPARKPLRWDELEALESALSLENGVVGTRGRFSPPVAVRAALMYEAIRWSGVRRSELLCLREVDLIASPPVLCVRKRAADWRETRGYRRPSVKRGERDVPIPASLASDLREGIARMRSATAFRADPMAFAFCTITGSPLSIARMDDIAQQIGRYASVAFRETFGSVPHTLNTFGWHRLRHTRATELLPVFLDAGPTGISEFLTIFGWASMRSANPYVAAELRNRAAIRLRSLHERGSLERTTYGSDRAPTLSTMPTAP